MKRLIHIVGIMLLASCHSTSEKDVKDAPLDWSYIEAYSPKQNWTWQEVVNKANPDFPDFPDPRYMEFFLKYDEYGPENLEFDTLNILLSTEEDFARLPRWICGIPARYYRHCYEIGEFHNKIQELSYEIRTDTNGNPTLFIGVYFITYLDTNDMESCHTFASQAYIDSVLQAHNSK